MDRIVTRQAIAQQAEQAARQHRPGAPLPPNPYCPALEPEHHEEWRASFARHLHNATADEVEGSA